MRQIQLSLITSLAAVIVILFAQQVIKKPVQIQPQQQIIIENTPKIQKTLPYHETPKYQQPNFTNWPPLRNINNLGKYLSDIESHMPVNHMYRDNSMSTWAHETTHGINSNIRNAAGPRMNGIYVLNNKAVVLKEPSTNLKTIAQRVPQSLRGQVYQLYLIKQTRDWNNEPLYLLDEWSAYTNGTLVSMELGLNRGDSAQSMTEFMVYSMVMLQTAEMTNHNPELLAFIRWFTERTMIINNYIASGRYPSMIQQNTTGYLEKFRTSNDAAGLRVFIKDRFGDEWAKRILNI